MGFVLKQISNVGSANPIVARLSLQFHEIIAFYDLADDAKEKIGLVLNKQIQQRLLACEKIAIELNNEITDALKIIREMGLKTQSNGRVLELPHIIGLEERIEPLFIQCEVMLKGYFKNIQYCVRHKF